MRKPSTLTQDELDDIRSMRERGVIWKVIAKKYNMRLQTLYQFIEYQSEEKYGDALLNWLFDSPREWRPLYTEETLQRLAEFRQKVAHK